MKFMQQVHVDFKDKRTSQQLILVILGGLVFFVLYVNLLFKPTLAGLNDVNPKLRKLKENIKMVQRWIKEKPEMERRLEELRGKMLSFETILSSEEEIPSLLEELSVMAKDSRVQILGIKPQAIIVLDSRVAKETYEEIPVSIRARCGYHQLGRFISKLESAKRLLVVQDIDIKTNPRTPRSHDVHLVVSTFLVKED